MIIGLPSPMQQFQVCALVPKNTLTRYAHMVGTDLFFTAPIDLKPRDHVWLDMRDGHVEIVERGGVTIWRAGWRN